MPVLRELILLKIHLFCIQDGTACPIVLNLLPSTLMKDEWKEGKYYKERVRMVAIKEEK